MDAPLAAGIARADITPPHGIAHANWGAQRHERAAGIDAPLYATALALGADDPAVIVDFDLLYLPAATAERMRTAVASRTGLPTDNVRLSWTHTHSGPSLRTDTWAEHGKEQIGPYLERLEHQAAGVAWQAVRDQVPARLAVDTATCEIAVNRRWARPEDGNVIVGRNPDGPVDHTVGVMRIDEVVGNDPPVTEPLATMVHYACHPITVGPDNDLITPDFPGAMKRTVAKTTNSVPVLLQGAAGDVGPIRGVARGGIDEYEALGRRLGYAVSQTWWALDPTGRTDEYVETLPSGAPLAVYEPTYEDPGSHPVSVTTRTVQLPVRDLPDPATARREYDELAATRDQQRREGTDAATIRETTARTRQAEIRANLADDYAGKDVQPVELQVITIGGDIALVAMPGEPFVEIQRGVQERSPFPWTFFSGYANVGTAYLPTADAYEEGGYEVEVTPFAPGAADRLIETAVETVTELRD